MDQSPITIEEAQVIFFEEIKRYFRIDFTEMDRGRGVRIDTRWKGPAALARDPNGPMVGTSVVVDTAQMKYQREVATEIIRDEVATIMGHFENAVNEQAEKHGSPI